MLSCSWWVSQWQCKVLMPREKQKGVEVEAYGADISLFQNFPTTQLVLFIPLKAFNCLMSPSPYNLLPRDHALKSTPLIQRKSKVNELCLVLNTSKKIQHKSLRRGMPTYLNHKYTAADTQPGWASAGVCDSDYLAKVEWANLKIVVTYVCNL